MCSRFEGHGRFRHLASVVCILPDACSSGAIRFRLVGTGACLSPNGLDVRGWSKRDLSLSDCKAACVQSCLGFTYSPCDEECIVHSDSADSATPMSEGWLAVSGVGAIGDADGRCGSSCFERKSPCEGGNVSSNGARVQYGSIPYGTELSTSCPYPFAGQVSLRCTVSELRNGSAVSDVIIQGGRCQEACAPGTWVFGDFDVPHGMVRHGGAQELPCPQGATGSVLLTCVDGLVQQLRGHCGRDCPQGAVRAGGAQIPVSFTTSHGQRHSLSCPAGYGGNATIECRNGVVYLEGRCDAHCSSGQSTLNLRGTLVDATFVAFDHGSAIEAACGPADHFSGNVTLACDNGVVSVAHAGSLCESHCSGGYVGITGKSVFHPPISHGSMVSIPCNEAFEGTLMLLCNDSVVTVLSGECERYCTSGHVISNFQQLDHASFRHGEVIHMTCPEGFNGILNATCDDGLVTFNGTCGRDCEAGRVFSNGAWLDHSAIKHGTELNLSCPQDPDNIASTYLGYILVQCNEREVRIRPEAVCLRPCLAYKLNEGDYGFFEHPDLLHGQEIVVPCQPRQKTLPVSGNITVRCNDVTIEMLAGTCDPDCVSDKLTNNGVEIVHPKLIGGKSVVLPCAGDSNAMFGEVEVLCKNSFAAIVGRGTCGNPCDAGQFSSTLTVLEPLSHGRIPHQKELEFQCPPCPSCSTPLSGSIWLRCNNRNKTIVRGECGERCLAQRITDYGVTFELPHLDHGASFSQPCSLPYAGNITVHCLRGRPLTQNGCKKPCAADSITAAGAALPYNFTSSGERQVLACPSGYSGSVTTLCNNGTASVEAGNCSRHCKKGRFQGAGYVLEFPSSGDQLRHGETTTIGCPLTHSGEAVLECRSGLVFLKEGGCFWNCPAGRFPVRKDVVMPHEDSDHDRNLPLYECPAGYAGTVQFRCEDGSLVVQQGQCHAHCPAGSFEGATHGLLTHGEGFELACDSFGMLTVACDDGALTKLQGYCFRGCPAGTILDSRGTQVAHGQLPHNGTAIGLCKGNSQGEVTVLCDDGVARVAVRDGQACLRHCDAAGVQTVDDSVVAAPALLHEHADTVNCPGVGSVIVKCFDGTFGVVDGECGSRNCPANVHSLQGATISYSEMNHGRRSGRFPCPDATSGEVRFVCEDGTVRLSELSILVDDPDIVTDAGVEPRIHLCECCQLAAAVGGPMEIEAQQTGVPLQLAFVVSVAASGLTALSAVYMICLRGGKSSRVAAEPDVAEFEAVKPQIEDAAFREADTQALGQLALQSESSPPAPTDMVLRLKEARCGVRSGSPLPLQH